MLKFNDFQTLITSAEAYYYLGYAVIPLLGDLDPARPKVAARPWSAYQHRLASLNEINDWFTPEGGAAALGIVTGHVSHLVVLDFDSPDLFETFRRKYPDLIETRTIQSAGRALPHLYFHLPSHLRLASQKRHGVDLLSDGRYVVAPPTTINGQSYRVTRGGTPHTLTAHDLSRLQSFLQSISSTKEESPLPIRQRGEIDESVGTQHAVSASTPLSMQWRGAGGEDDLPPSPSSTNTTPSVGEGLRPSRIDPFTSLNSTPIENNPILTPLSIQWRGAGGEVSPTRADLHRLYAYWRSQGGRNDALFKTALYARDHGLTELQTRRALVPLHISTPAAVGKGLRPFHALSETPLFIAWRGVGGEDALTPTLTSAVGTRHVVSAFDTPAHRQSEAYATIHSAFSRPPRISTVGTQHAVSAFCSPSPFMARGLGGEVNNGKAGLPNTLREALLQRKMTFVVRTLEGLLQSGIRPGQGFTTDHPLKALKGIVGRDSIYNALNALAPDGQPIFPQRPPSALPQASKEAARDNRTLKTKKCFFVTKKKSGIKKRGVQQRRFKFPKIETLCKRFGVQESASDPLTRDDLASAHRTRMALHRELIKRRPAEYSRRWLANRIGVTRRTLDTYNRLIPIHIQPTYHETPLSWNNIDALLSNEILSGAHIETLMGKKYPTLKAVAAKLIAKGTYIRLMQRKSSFYWYGSNQPPTTSVETRPALSASRSPSPFMERGLGGEVSPATYPQHAVSTSSTPLPVLWGGAGGGVMAVPTQSAYSSTSSVGTRHVVSMPSAPVLWGGAGGGVIDAGLRGEDMSFVETQPALSASHSPSPFMERGLGGEVSPATYPRHVVSMPSAPVLWGGVINAAVGGKKDASAVGTQHAVSAPSTHKPKSFRAPLPDAGQEALAQTLYTRVNACGNPKTRHLSLGNARKLVHTYPAPHIHAALNRLQQRTNLDNPTGFFVTVLRSSAQQKE